MDDLGRNQYIEHINQCFFYMQYTIGTHVTERTRFRLTEFYQS